MTTTIEYALLAGDSYYDTRTDKNRFSLPQNWSVLSRAPSDATTGFEASVFQNGTEIVISFAGTYANPNSLSTNPDMQADLAMGLGMWSAQLGQAADYYLPIKNNPLYQGAHITLTGHSLGGGLAALIAVFFGETAVTFDQAPFAETAKFQAQALMNYLTSEVDTQGHRVYTDTQLSGLTSYIQQQQANITLLTPIPNSNLVTNISVEGQLLSGFPYSLVNTIGSDQQPPLASSHAGVAGEDLHSQALLIAFLQSQQTATAYTAGNVQETLSNVTYPLTDLLKMIFDKNLFAYETDDPDNRNFIDHVVRHEFGNAPGVTTADTMVTRFTADLWKLAQEGGLTLNDDAGWANLHNISNALIAFAMQFYYEDSANATDKNKQLFTDMSAAGEGSNGIRFDMHDVSKDVAGAMDSIDPNVKVDLTKAKGYQYFLTYIDTSLLLSSEERALIKSMLPYMRDWYIQAGTGGMNATDTLNRGAFILGGSGQDILTGGAKADLLVGNAGDDILTGGGGSDVLIGGSGVDTYVLQAGTNSGIDTILDSDNTGYLRDDTVSPIVITGGAQYGDNKVFRGTDANGASHLYTFVTGNLATGGDLLVDGAMLVLNYNPALGNHMGITLTGAVAVINPITTRDIKGDLKPIETLVTVAVGGIIDPIYLDTTKWKYVSMVSDGATEVWTFYELNDLGNVITDQGIAAPSLNDILNGSSGNDHIMSGGGSDHINATQGGNDLIESGTERDFVEAGNGNNVIMGGAAGDILISGNGNDFLYADTQVDVATAIAQGNAQTGTGLQGDWLTSTGGDDTLVGSNANDVLMGGAGSDLLIGGAGDDDIVGDGGFIVHEFGWSVYSTSTARVFEAFPFGPPITGEWAPAGGAADVIYAGEGNDHAWGGMGNDVIFGEGGNDYLVGDEGNDILMGGAGQDTIFGGTGEDILIGGTENDILNGGDGRDIYIFNRGDGGDTVYDSKADNNIFRFGAGISASDITLNLGSLKLNLGNGDEIHIANFDQNDVFNSSSISSFEFDDGTVLTTTELLARGFDLDGTAGADTLTGTNTIDRISGLGGDDALYGGDGNDTLDGGAGNDRIYADSQIDTATAIANGNISNSGSGLKGDWLAGVIEQYRFADGSVLTHQQMVDRAGGIYVPPPDTAGKTFDQWGDMIIGTAGGDINVLFEAEKGMIHAANDAGYANTFGGRWA